MTTEGLDAWFLHKQPSGNTSLWVSLFTREKGLIRVQWKGALASKKKQLLLQPFTLLWLGLNVRQHSYYINNLETTATSYHLTGNSLMAALYLNELVFYTLQPLDPNPDLFNIYHNTMQALAADKTPLNLEKALRQFEWSLIECCGYGFSCREERNGKPINSHLFYQFIAGEGFVVAEQGISGNNILALNDNKFASPSTLKLAKFLMRQAINHLLDGKELKSRQLIKNIYCIKET